MKWFFLLILFSFTVVNGEKKDILSLKELLASKNILPSKIILHIDKSDRIFKVMYKEETIRQYNCVLGFSPIGDKFCEGDGKTPLGEFKIRSKYAHKSWKYFIWIDYPNKESWKRFNERKLNGELDKSASIGGEIGIHGVPENSDYLIDDKTDWTLGCISLKNNDITDLYYGISLATKIRIVE